MSVSLNFSFQPLSSTISLLFSAEFYLLPSSEKKVLGRWIVITNLEDKSRDEIINDYKSLQEIERNFRVLKSELNLRPVNHSRDNRCIAHIYLCVLTLLIKHIIEKKFGRDELEEIKNIFSYEIVTEKGEFVWTEKF